jgi:hypothetical protein
MRDVRRARSDVSLNVHSLFNTTKVQVLYYEHSRKTVSRRCQGSLSPTPYHHRRQNVTFAINCF